MKHKPGKAPRLVCASFILVGLSLLFFACQVSVSCLDPLGCSLIKSSGKIQIGFEKATIGEERMNSANLLEELQQILSNRQSTHAEPQLELVIFDTSCSPVNRAQEAARIAATPDLVALIGPACQANNEDFLQLISNAGLNVLSPVVLDPTQFPGIFPMLPGTAVQAQALVQFLAPILEKKEIFLVFEQNPIFQQFSQNVCDEFARAILTCASPIGFEDISDLTSILSDRSHPVAHNILVITPMSKLHSFPDFSENLASYDFYFYDPFLSTRPEPIDQKGNLYAITAVRPSSNPQPPQNPFSDCTAPQSLTAILGAISRSSQKDNQGNRMISLLAMRKSLEFDWSKEIGPGTPHSLPISCNLTKDNFSIVPLAVDP
jgi:hypothetical protein